MSALDKLLEIVKDRLSNRGSSSPRVPRNVKPASQDPYGDPADEYRGRSVKPASQDPWGDPADEDRRK